MSRLLKITVCVTLLVIATSFMLWVIFTNKKQPNSEDSILLEKTSELIEVADSVRNSRPDTALAVYNKAISLLQNTLKAKSQSNLLAKAYIGIATIYSEKGDYPLALKNDSIALEIATRFEDKQLLAKAYVIRGVTLNRLSEYDKSLDCYVKAENLAIEIKDLVTQAKILANRAKIYSAKGDDQKSIDGYTRALRIGKQLKNEPLIAANYMNLAMTYVNLSENDSALVYNKLALALFNKMNDKKGEVLCYRNIGNTYYEYSDFGKAIEYYDLSIKFAIELNDKPSMAKGYHNLAEVYIHLGDNGTATDLLFKSIKIKEQLNDKLSLAKGYFGLGEMYYNRSEYPKALTYFKKSLKLSQELKNVIQIGSNFSSIANVYSDENKLDSAILFYNKAMELYKQIDYRHGISNLYINLGDVYRVKKDYSKSEEFLLQALKAKVKLEEEEGRVLVDLYLANLYLSMSEQQLPGQKNNMLKKAEGKGLESYNSAKSLGALPIQRDVSMTLKKIYKQQGRYREALQYSEISTSLNDSLLNKDKVQALTFAEARWNADKKQQEINNLENIQKLQQEIIQRKEAEARQHRLIIWFIVVLFLLAGISTVVIAMYIHKRRDALYQKQLTSINALRMQNTRNTMSPHFFLNVLATLTGLSAQPERLKEKLRSLALLLRKMIENIDQMAIPLEEEIKAVKAYIDLSRDKIPGTFNVEYLIAEGTNLEGLIPAMLIQIPVENAIKHGLIPLDGDKTLTISIADYDDHQHIAISDNGIGLKASTGRSTGTGTGLKVLLQTIHLLNANNHHKIDFAVGDRTPVAEDSSGTTVSIKIPVNFNYIL